MDHNFEIDANGDEQPPDRSQAERLLARALLSAQTQDGPTRSDPAPRGGQGGSQALSAVDQLCAELRAEVQKVIELAARARSAAEADRARARRDMEQAAAARAEADASLQEARNHLEAAETARLEAERASQQLEAEARQRSSQLVQEALRQANEQAANIRRLATEEMRRLLDTAASVWNTTEEALEARRTVAVRTKAPPQEPTVPEAE